MSKIFLFVYNGRKKYVQVNKATWAGVCRLVCLEPKVSPKLYGLCGL